MRLSRVAVVALFAATATIPALPGSAASGTTAKPKPPVVVEGWTTYPRLQGVQVQAKAGKTIKNCYTAGNNQREINVVWTGRIKYGSKLAVAIWGGPSDGFFATEPTDASLKAGATKWTHKKQNPYRTAYGYTFAAGPYGAENIDGVWHAKFWVAGKIVKRVSVTVKCNP
jgi:hypothetical protein